MLVQPILVSRVQSLHSPDIENVDLGYAPPPGGLFYWCVSGMSSLAQSSSNESWERLFFAGMRLHAEVLLHANRFNAEPCCEYEYVSCLQQLHRSWGRELHNPDLPLPHWQAAYRDIASRPEDLRDLVKQQPFYPDPLLLWAMRAVLPRSIGHAYRRRYLRRIGLLLLRQYPGRLDLLLALLNSEGAADLLKGLPDQLMPASAFYGNVEVSMMYLQSLWAKGRYSQLLMIYSGYQLVHRWFPGSDYVLRCYTVIGKIERVDTLFRDIYQRYLSQVQPATLSNMLFTALGLDQLDQAYVSRLVAHWRVLTRPAVVAPKSFSVAERPTVVVISADLRMHPVGRFWLPIAQSLRPKFRLVHVGFNPHDNDGVREQLQACSDGWHLLENTAHQDTETLLHQLKPQFLLDLGGHTADNRPGLLNQRFAPVQATYLGFYGPSYAEECDWWILDRAIARRVRNSYPGSEAIWELPGPSLCYDPTAHGLPEPESILYSEPDHAVIGSFNHTRKLTSSCIERFGSVLSAMPKAVLQFRSHSFYDPAVRRWFLRQFLDAGIAAEQLQPLPYAPSGHDALKDYGRIHLHLDSYPVSGTTTTLDSLAMGIPVLSCPNHLYAGAISAAILEHAGLSEMVCEHPSELPQKAKELCRRYATAEARRELAKRVRASAVCDTQEMPAMFAEQLGQMLRRSR